MERVILSDQGEVDKSHSGHEKPGQQQARDVGANERQESLKDHHCTSGSTVDCDIERPGSFVPRYRSDGRGVILARSERLTRSGFC